MTGFWDFNEAAQQEQEEADQTAQVLRRQIQKRISALQSQIRSHGVRGEFALAGAQSAASDLDLGEAVGSMVVSLCLWGPVAMGFGSDTASHFFFGDNDSSFSWAGLTEGIGFLIDAEIDGVGAAKKRKGCSYYPQGRRQTKIETVRDMFGQFNAVANRRLGQYSQRDLKTEMRFMQLLLKALAQLDRNGKGYEFTEETRFQSCPGKQLALAA